MLIVNSKERKDNFMKYKNCIVAYTASTPIIKLFPFPCKEAIPREFESTIGACFSDVRELKTKAEVTAQVFIDFVHMVVRDDMDADRVHKAFLEIDEYRDAMADDMPIVNGYDFYGKRIN